MDTVHVAWLGLRLTGPTEGAWTLAPRSGGPSMGRLVTSHRVLTGSIIHTGINAGWGGLPVTSGVTMETHPSRNF